MRSPGHCDVAIVGSGFGGSILARALRARGLDVALIERSAHPRFALGESSTPLAALSLERLAEEYGLPDLSHLATYGRWQQYVPKLRCGLKRGFTFHDHRRGEPSADSRRSLLVAASPEDSLADCHWLRADVDHHLVRRAVGEGVRYLERTMVTGLEIDDHRVLLRLSGPGSPPTLSSSLLVDAGGPSGVARSLLGVALGPPPVTRSSLVYGHFRNVGLVAGAPSREPPYPPERAAVHHLIDGGWVYSLRFDDGTVSAGALLSDPPSDDAPTTWAGVLSSHPALGRAFAEAEPLAPLRGRATIQHRLASAVGPRWVLLPHTLGFIDPLFSTGIAWTLRGVERLADALSPNALAENSFAPALARYDDLLQAELTQIDRLISGAYRAMPRFELFAAYALTYFAAVSWAELRQRLLRPEGAHWEGFLGTDDPLLADLFEDARRRLPTAPDAASRRETDAYRAWILDRLAARDLLGLDRYGPELAVPVDLELLGARVQLLGLASEDFEARLHLLRGEESPQARSL